MLKHFSRTPAWVQGAGVVNILDHDLPWTSYFLLLLLPLVLLLLYQSCCIDAAAPTAAAAIATDKWHCHHLCATATNFRCRHCYCRCCFLLPLVMLLVLVVLLLLLPLLRQFEQEKSRHCSLLGRAVLRFCQINLPWVSSAHVQMHARAYTPGTDRLG